MAAPIRGQYCGRVTNERAVLPLLGLVVAQRLGLELLLGPRQVGLQVLPLLLLQVQRLLALRTNQR